MSAIVHMAGDSHAIYTFAKALQQLAARDGQLTPPLESFLTSNASKLTSCARPFKTPEPSSRSKIDAGKFTADTGESVTLGEREKGIVKSVADTLLLDEVESAILIKRYRQSKGEDASIDIEAAVSRSDVFWQDITSFVLEEQLRIIQLVALLLRTVDFEVRIPTEVVKRFTAEVTTPEFAQGLLDRVSHLATTPVPTSAVPNSSQWAKYGLLQQKALLEVYFLLYYNRLFPNGKSLLNVLHFIETTVWGTHQVNRGLFDIEAHALTQDVTALCHVILIENMNLERAASSEAQEFNLIPGEMPAQEEILHYQTLQDLHQRILGLISLHPQHSALLALAWAFLLFRITESISSVPLPGVYYDIAQQILPVDLQPRKDAIVPQANLSGQALWQQLVTHALSPHVACLSLLREVITTPLISPNDHTASLDAGCTDPNVAGYLSVFRSLLACLSRLVHPTYLPAEDFDRLIGVFEAMYQNPEAGLLRGNFWGLFDDSDGNPIREEEWQIFDVAAKRFPAQVGPLTRLLLAVSGGRQPDLLETSKASNVATKDKHYIEANCADHTVRYLSRPQTLTQMMPNISPLLPLPYEPSKASHSPTDIVATRQIKISPSLVVNPGTIGRIVSPMDQRPLIVSWDISHTDTSATTFRFYGDYLQTFAARLTGKKVNPKTTGRAGDIFESSGTQDVPDCFFGTVEAQMSEATCITALLRNVLQHLPSKSEQILQATFEDAHAGIRSFFTIFEHTAASEQATSLFVVTANILTVLLATHADDVWTLLRSSDIAFPLGVNQAMPVWGSKAKPASRNALMQDKILGDYSRTLACLELVQGLIQEAQWSVGADQAASRELKASVLDRAMRWMMSSILPSYASWKYRDLRQKHEIGSCVASIIRDVLQETYSGAQGSLVEAFSIVSEALLHKAGHVQLSAIMNIISTGSSVLGAFQHLGKTADCYIVERCIHQHLQVVNRLLQLSRDIGVQRPVLLERLLFAHENDSLFRSVLPEMSQNPMYMLIEYLVKSDSSKIATEAAGSLTKLCQLSIDWGQASERPSLLSHLGSIRDTEAILRRLVELAGDPFGDLDLQLSTWRLLRAIAGSQPGFSALLVTGQQALDSFSSPGSAETGQSISAFGLALQVVFGYEEAWRVQPAILSAALSFLLELWQQYAESSQTLQARRQQENLWSTLVEILKLALPTTQSDPSIGNDLLNDMELEQAHRRYAQAAAAALYATELQIMQMSESGTLSGGPQNPAKVFQKLLRDAEQLKTICLSAIEITHVDERIGQLKAQVAEVYSQSSLDMYIQPRLVDSAPYGPHFYYDTAVLAKRRPVASDALDVSLSSSKGTDIMDSVYLVNVLWSRADAEGALLKAAFTWLQIGLANAVLTEQDTRSLQIACQALLRSVTTDSDGPPLVEVRYTGHLRLILVMLEQLSGQHVECNKDFSLDLIKQLASVIANDAFSLEASLHDPAQQYSNTIFKLVTHAFRIVSKTHDASPAIRKSFEPKYYDATESCLLSCIKACNSLVIAARNTKLGSTITEDITWAASAICEMISSILCPSSAVWLAYCLEVEFFRHCLDYIATTDFEGNAQRVAHSILNLFLAMASDFRTAEKLALEGLVFSLCNNALTGELEAGRLHGEEMATGKEHPQHTSAHETWILYLSNVTQLTIHLGKSHTFMDQEVSTFIQLYRLQIHRALSWTANATLALSELQELRAVLSLLSACVKYSRGTPQLQTPIKETLMLSLRTLPQLVYLLQRPNLLLSLIEATTPSQNMWLAAEPPRSDAIDLSDFHSQPVIASLCQEMLSLCWLIISTVIAHTDCFSILTRDRVDWPKDCAIIIASANVSLDEPATYGTLFDLARFCTDVIRHCSAPPASTRNGLPLPPYNVATMREIAEQCLEGTLLLLSTQIALTVQQQDLAGSEGRAGQRARRDLKEIASDLVEEFLDKASSSQQSQERRLPEVLKDFVLRL